MRNSVLSRWGRMVTVVLLAGAALMATTTGAGATPPATGPSVGTLPFSLTGNWTDNGSAMPTIINNGNNIVVDMSYANRPTAFGTVTSATTIAVNFPDAGRITGTVPRNGVIQWSNGSVWRQVYTGSMVIDINGTWLDPVSIQRITLGGGYLRVFFQNGRPTAVGFAGNATTIQVTFPDDATYLATVDPGGFIRWSNNTTWTRPIIP
jgi:hypothetical protein